MARMTNRHPCRRLTATDLRLVCATESGSASKLVLADTLLGHSALRGRPPPFQKLVTDACFGAMPLNFKGTSFKLHELSLGGGSGHTPSLASSHHHHPHRQQQPRTPTAPTTVTTIATTPVTTTAVTCTCGDATTSAAADALVVGEAQPPPQQRTTAQPQKPDHILLTCLFGISLDVSPIAAAAATAAAAAASSSSDNWGHDGSAAAMHELKSTARRLMRSQYTIALLVPATCKRVRATVLRQIGVWETLLARAQALFVSLVKSRFEELVRATLDLHRPAPGDTVSSDDSQIAIKEFWTPYSMQTALAGIAAETLATVALVTALYTSTPDPAAITDSVRAVGEPALVLASRAVAYVLYQHHPDLLLLGGGGGSASTAATEAMVAAVRIIVVGAPGTVGSGEPTGCAWIIALLLDPSLMPTTASPLSNELPRLVPLQTDRFSPYLPMQVLMPGGGSTPLTPSASSSESVSDDDWTAMAALVAGQHSPAGAISSVATDTDAGTARVPDQVVVVDIANGSIETVDHHHSDTSTTNSAPVPAYLLSAMAAAVHAVYLALLYHPPALWRARIEAARADIAVQVAEAAVLEVAAAALAVGLDG
ncbi:hypothetical protein BC828DRAFT_386131 [Blastocladiella britannica]|nr:hypothetical protein BC828DRAFT_386131 [Blastocladiella britannica]